jgi:hypothetical protein
MDGLQLSGRGIRARSFARAGRRAPRRAQRVSGSAVGTAKVSRPSFCACRRRSERPVGPDDAHLVASEVGDLAIQAAGK